MKLWPVNYALLGVLASGWGFGQMGTEGSEAESEAEASIAYLFLLQSW